MKKKNAANTKLKNYTETQLFTKLKKKGTGKIMHSRYVQIKMEVN